MPFKTLINLYFDNKVQVLPAGAISFFSYLNELEHLLKTPGLIEIDEADLKTVLSDANKITIVAIKGGGENKTSVISRKLAELAESKIAHNAHGAFFHVIGDPDITLFDVNEIAESVYPLLNEKADIIFGAAVDDELDNSIKILLVLVE